MARKKKTQRRLSLSNAAFAGTMATIPMTLFMLRTQRHLPEGERYALPPEILTKELADRFHISYKMSKTQLLIATTFSHFAYGATMGMLYRPIGKEDDFVPGIVKGTFFALVIWVVSYLIALPLVGMSESGKTETPLRNLMMIGAHVIWGAAMGSAADALIEMK